MLRSRSLAVWFAAFAVALSACTSSGGSDSSYGAGDPSLAASNPGGGPINPFLTDGKAVTQALNAIAAKSGRPLRITSIDADRMNGLTVNVQEPANHVNVDQYVVSVDGKLSGPTPVKTMSLNGGPITAADVDREAFDPRLIAFNRLEHTAREAIAKSKFPDARVTQWELNGIAADDRKFMYLEAARGRPVAVIDKNLTISRMQF